MLIFIMITAIVTSQLYLRHLKSRSSIVEQEALTEWVQTVEASIALKAVEEEVDKTVYLPRTYKAYSKKELPKHTDEPKETVEPVIIIKDLNQATAEELQQVKGIGPSYSERIIKYRSLLGGFSSMKQLNEVYGLQQETIERLSEHFEIQSGVHPFNINSDSAKVLAKHPYISYDLAWIIINYRKQNGDILSAEDLRKIKAVDEETFNRLKPYLD